MRPDKPDIPDIEPILPTEDAAFEPPAPGTRGLARTIAKAGYASRRQAEEMVRSGRVTVDGKRYLDPYMSVTPDREILIDGAPVVEIIRSYFAFNKPAEVTTSPGVGHRHPTMNDFLPRDVPGLQPAGRLDVGTSGLLLLSNDSAWNAAAASGHGHTKEFLVTVRKAVSDGVIEIMAAGIKVPHVGKVLPSVCGVERRSESETVIRIALSGGKIRHLRSLCATLNLVIDSVHRVRIGPVSLGTLVSGRCRALSRDEIEGIRAGAGE